MIKVPEESISKTIEYLEKNKLGKEKNFRLKDWGVSSKDTGDVQFNHL